MLGEMYILMELNTSVMSQKWLGISISDDTNLHRNGSRIENEEY
jgi:hypothetical protein